MPDDGRRQATPEPFIAAAVQRPPAFLDLAAAVGSAVDAVAEASGEGARLIVFPETWLPTYPYWHAMVSERASYSDLYQRLFKSSLSVPGPDFDRLAAAARRAAATVVIGVNEREEAGGTIYNTLCYIGPDGHLLGKHRKLVPTLSERLIWGSGDGSDLDVYGTSVGRLGGLICLRAPDGPGALRSRHTRHRGARLRLARPRVPSPHRRRPPPATSPMRTATSSSSPREIFSAALLPAGTPLAEAARLGGPRRQRHHRPRREIPRRTGLRRGDHRPTPRSTSTPLLNRSAGSTRRATSAAPMSSSCAGTGAPRHPSKSWSTQTRMPEVIAAPQIDTPPPPSIRSREPQRYAREEGLPWHGVRSTA